MGNLKVLHISDSDLDDPRIVSAAVTGNNAGYDEYFCGENKGHTFKTDAFTKFIWITIPSRARIAKEMPGVLGRYWTLYPYPRHALELERQIRKAVEETRPDIIHAHNIFTAHHASKLGIPMVLDDHELYSMHIKAQNENAGLQKRIISGLKYDLWSQWEIDLGEKHPVITVSEQIAQHYRKFCKNAFVVPNYPNANTIRFDGMSEASKGMLCSAYLGRDLEESPNSVRNISGLHKVFSGTQNTGNLLRIGVSEPNTSRIKSVGLLKMDDAYKTLNREAHIGLVPWKKHWFHEYCNPNKVYEYAHCGLWLAVTDDLKPVLDDFGKHCDKFSSHEELANLLVRYNDNPEELNRKRHASLEHARKNMVWEKVESRVLDAYKAA